MIIIGFKGELAAAFIFVIIHEGAHYFVARKLGYSGFDVKILPIGAVLNLKDLDDASLKEDIIISIAGPSMNFILALIFCSLWKKFNINYFYDFYMSNMALGLFNLIPAFPLDGGRILRDILWSKYIYKVANKKTIFISIIIGLLIMSLYFILFFRGIYNLNLGLIALFIIVVSLKEKERIAYLIMGDIIKKKYKFLRKGYIENRSVSIYAKSDLLTAVGLLEKNKYNIFLVLNEKMNVIKTLCEEQLIEGLKEYGNISIEEFIRKNNL